jgi:hypothetical protein
MTDVKKPDVKVEPEKKASGEIADAVKQVLESVLPALMAAREAPAPVKKTALPEVVDFAMCTECGQPHMACRGRHRKCRVLPSDEDQVEWFQGVKINGVNYLSPLDGREITVPADANIEYMVQQWSQNERELVRGKKRIRNSGSVGPGGTGPRKVGPGDYFR